jgi:hypothetical protein
MESEVPRENGTTDELKHWKDICHKQQNQLQEKKTLVMELREAIQKMGAEIQDGNSKLVSGSP